jgi:peptide-methionine (S)-S-oxide reductase
MRSPARLVSVLLAVATAGACASSPLAAAEVPPPARDLPAPSAGAGPKAIQQTAPLQTMVVAMGCFWCAEGVFERIEGVTDVTSGYAGGTRDNANYEAVSAGSTNHAESVRITYDPRKISYGRLLQVFFTTHDPTTKDRQGPDWGHQYRSAIFFANPEQRAVAAEYIRQLEEAHVFKAPIVTTLEPLDAFYPAEDYHQDYVRKHPDNPYVRMWFPAKEQKLREHLAPLLKHE